MQRAFRITFARWSEFFPFQQTIGLAVTSSVEKTTLTDKPPLTTWFCGKTDIADKSLAIKVVRPRISLSVLYCSSHEKGIQWYKGLEFKYFFTPKSWITLNITTKKLHDHCLEFLVNFFPITDTFLRDPWIKKGVFCCWGTILFL